ncbi:Armadillo-like helical [Macrophomina phaseolina MS6]|uniref:Armadillo-like helical n=1 Tax=Macrophomina phaseolina (strain MS6) TaxID=1126212 RepID=K2S188_MACPH|nr:Armadillo-like helical [Macrophomina phaseolina MS6]
MSQGTITPVTQDESVASRPALSTAKPANASATAAAAVDHDPVSNGQASAEPMATDAQRPKEALTKLLNGKEKEWTAIAEKKGPIQLLDLPVDILKAIIDHLPHTNDLTSLALCHSALHAITIPHIYARFDIVWPDNTVNAEQRSGVDALTYGLATLVMGMELFGESPAQRIYAQQRKAEQMRNSPRRDPPDEPFPIPRRRHGNPFAEYTKKFSLGNGPPEWVQEYLITKESGKMLGTLVATAVARMRNLETFVWDMPTGVLRDVWLALSSLATRDDGHDCRLERLWIRWHDNSAADLTAPIVPPPMPVSHIPPPPPHAHHVSGVAAAPTPMVVPVMHSTAGLPVLDRVEHPTFSVIPALKSLSVLDIDELPYLDEMAILIGRSQNKLRELRVGIARHAHDQERDWVTAWEGDGVQQVDHSTLWTAASKIGEKRLGGVLGILVGRVYNMRRNSETAAQAEASSSSADRALASGALPAKSEINLPEQPAALEREQETGPVPEIGQPSVFGTPLPTSPATISHTTQLTDTTSSSSASSEPRRPLRSRAKVDVERQEREKNMGPTLSTKLKLETLELERVPLSVSVLLKAFDWSRLTTLTLLNCSHNEQLWKALRRQFTPRSPPQTLSSGSPSKAHAHHIRPEYSLNLKKIHTNTVSPSLIAFLKETLAPNSLEVLFLQEDRTYHSTVTIDSIFRGPLKRHRASLKKLMIDSSEKGALDHVPTNTRWKRWMLNREIITFMTSGRMPSLRELAFTIDYHDWHFFLQRLPNIPTVRSLYIPHIAEHAHGNNIDPRELALQIVDIITLRPEIEICYMGIVNKCFEVLENKVSTSSMGGAQPYDPTAANPSAAATIPGVVDPMGFTDDEEEEEEDEVHDEDDPGAEADEDTEDEDEDDDSDELDDDDDDDSFIHSEDGNGGPRLRLREILFYDDKVAIFKARHGRL